jgi:hypothetical protein
LPGLYYLSDGQGKLLVPEHIPYPFFQRGWMDITDPPLAALPQEIFYPGHVKKVGGFLQGIDPTSHVAGHGNRSGDLQPVLESDFAQQPGSQLRRWLP